MVNCKNWLNGQRLTVRVNEIRGFLWNLPKMDLSKTSLERCQREIIGITVIRVHIHLAVSTTATERNQTTNISEEYKVYSSVGTSSLT